MAGEPVDYDRLMQANLKRVFGERDGASRVAALRQLYAEDAILYEPDSEATGHAQIDQAVTRLWARLPPHFGFSAIGPALGHHGVGHLRWRLGPPDGPAAVTGTDIVRIEDGRIQTLHVFIDPAGADADR